MKLWGADKISCLTGLMVLALTGSHTAVAQETVVRQPPAMEDQPHPSFVDHSRIAELDRQEAAPYFPNLTDDNIGDGIDTKAIIGRDDRRKVVNTEAYPYSAIVVFFDSHQEARCSGALIGPDTILTAAHCLVDDNNKLRTGYTFCPGAYVPESRYGGGSSGGGWGSSSVDVPNNRIRDKESSSWLFGYRKSDYIKPHGCTDATSVWWDSKYSPWWRRHDSTEGVHGDIALVHLREPLGEDSGYFGFSSRTVNDTKLYVTGYPGDKDMLTQWTDWSTDVQTDGDLIWHGVDTFGGQSGSPVYIKDGPYVVGVHDGSIGRKNVASRITSARFDYFDHLAREGGW